MRNPLVLVLAVILTTGCAGMDKKEDDSRNPPHVLDVEWRPLEDVRERPRIVRDLGSKTAITTVGRHAYVRDLDEWLGRVVPGTPKYRGVLRHEQEHARRQIKTGVFLWIARYSYDREFALLEEQIGYYYEITDRRRFGGTVVPEAYASVLSKYKNLSGRLISYEDALRWVRDVLSGRWSPPTS